ncbi:MAG: diguanylate cyclase [Chloroflexi bacterium]|nr:diguanylate cyclase [Chloroflexota bacterium]
MVNIVAQYQFTPYSVILLFATLIGMVVAWAAVRRRTTPGAGYLALMELAAAEWAFAIFFESAATTVPLKLLWSQIAYFGTATSACFYFLFALGVAQEATRLTRRAIIMLLAVPSLTIAIALTNEWHHWLWTTIDIQSPSNLAVYSHGPWFWVFLVYSYTMVLAGMVTLVRSTRQLPPFFRPQMLLILAGSLVTAAGNVIYVFNVNPLPGMDWTPISFALNGAILAWGIFRNQLFDLVPVARAQLIENMVDGVLVVNTQGRILDINPAALRLLGVGNQTLIGRQVDEILKVWPRLAHYSGEGLVLPVESRPGKGVSCYVDVRGSLLRDQWQRPSGYLFILRDITQRRQMEEELRQANVCLQHQLQENQLLQDKLQAEAIHDELTGVFNRRYLVELLALGLVRRGNQPFSLLMLDLDHLKVCNDAYGHQVGDRLLRQLSDLLSRNIRAGDALCRYGGDEFVIVLPNTSPQEAYQCAERWRAAVESMIWDLGGYKLRTTISMGVAGYPGMDGPNDTLLVAADQALYAAKASGRNRVVLWHPGIAHGSGNRTPIGVTGAPIVLSSGWRLSAD